MRALVIGCMCFHSAAGVESVMNRGGVPYAISNAWPEGAYHADFGTGMEYFDVFGEVHTKYSQVYWKRNNPINLPPELVKRFDGKVMAITGYEVDQVVYDGPQTGSTTNASGLGGFSCYPACPGHERSIPSYHSYNHHYFSWLVGKDGEVFQREQPMNDPHPGCGHTMAGVRDKPGVKAQFPTNIVFKENPGGEYRKSYHGYPRGFAQLVESPRQWVVEAMQIDTHNRNYNLTDTSNSRPWFLPKRVQNNMTDLTSGLNPLIECPCTDRIRRKMVIENGTKKHYWAYMNNSFYEFEGYHCAGEPRGDMHDHGDGTGRSVPNPACSPETYHGGMHCCMDGYLLTDIDQEAMIPDETDVMFLKFRYYFQEYSPAPVSHKHLHHWVFLIDEAINDYEESCVSCGTPHIGKIRAKLQAKDMGLEDVPKPLNTITPLVMTPHCHAPSCIRQELWNSDTGEILCNSTVRYGSPEHGSMQAVFNEANYAAISPCLWGNQPGLRKPFSLRPDTNLTAIKYFNNTFRHLGQMAQWTGLVVYNDPVPLVYV